MADNGKLTILALQNLLGVAIDKLEPIAVDAGLAKIRAALDANVEHIAKHQEQKGWGGGKIGDSHNDWQGDAIAKQCDDALFVLAMVLPGDVTDWFRDHVSPLVTPQARAMLTESSTGTEIVQAEIDQLYALVESDIRGATGVPEP